ncbi:oligopeptide ABC transporter substrate-binding protein [Streptococcus macacae NCTC 11558]|uniref:ABC transporter, substrate-binding protein, family 5 n=1 Tax=Streptococcus macacae NCTC 11558 TaxID=764298 RepID=G5JW92_9STRE|nr:ABC transporter, substrate-binding protein, family 5 [Streptococcus macacae NCTC 11558]SUN77747.1 oligopeptide ABC transporter substrate-binding protein [Streptococcus macacae NCTC 11558]
MGGAVLLLAFILSACGRFNINSSKYEINWYFPEEIATLDISKSTDVQSGIAIGNSQSNLLRINDKGKPVPDLASKVEVSKDGLTYVATLRKGIKWSDGSAITAEDFVYSWKRIVNPKTASEYSKLAIESHVKNARAINNGQIKDLNALGVKAQGNKVIFNLESPSPQMHYFLAFTSFMPQKETFINKIGKKYGTNADSQLYSGPYTLSGWNGTNGNFKLKKNKHYWNAGKVKTKVINIQTIKKPDTAVQMYKRGDLDSANISNTAALYKANKANKDAINIFSAATAYMEYNQTGSNKALANKKIRQALNYATNRQAFVNTAVPTGSRPATGIVPYKLAKVGNQDLSDYVAPGYEYNINKARQLFKEGLKEINETHVTLSITSDADSPIAKSGLDYIKGSWEKSFSGLTVEEKYVPFKQRLQDSQMHNFDIMMTTWGGDYPEGSTFYALFTEDSPQNNGRFLNSAYNQAYNKATTTDILNPLKRADDYKTAEKALLDEANINPLYFSASKTLQNPNIKGLIRNSTGLNVDFTYAYKK